MASLRQRIQECLLELSEDAIVDLHSLFPNPGEISPPPTIHSRIPMDEQTNTANLMEVIVYNLYKSNAKLQVSTWCDLFAFERTFGGAKASEDRWRERSFEILFVVSKVDMIEYTTTIEVTFDYYFTTVLQSLKHIVYKKVGAGSASPAKTQDGKRFLKSPSIVLALSRCLMKVLNGNELAKEISNEKIQSIVDEMGIYVVDELSMLRGIVVKDGVVLNSNKLNRIPRDTMKYEANYFTTLVHEAAHFVVRRFVNDFGFSSPIKYDDAGEKIYDPVIGSKGLEMGRYMEILLFGLQPEWTASTRLAAFLFRRRAFAARSSLPLFSRLERAILLRKRQKGSLSMAGDFTGSMPNLDWPDIFC